MNSIVVEHLSKCYRLGRKNSYLNSSRRLRKILQLLGVNLPDKRPPREVWALRDVSFAVESGTILGIVGPNGAGKTTLLKILGRLTLPTEGRVTGKGRVASLLGVGLGFQPDLTGYENIFLHAAMYGIPRADVLSRLDNIVEFAEVEDFIDTPLRHYSSGMYLRLAFSVAVNMQPDILLADEVLAVGDLAFQERCLRRVQEAGKAGMTVLFVSHDMAAITRLCHRVMWLNAGRIVRCGDPEEVVTQYQDSARALPGTRFKQGKRRNSQKKYGEILSVRLVSAEGTEVGAARVSEDVFVKATFNILEPGVSVRCAFRVFTRGIHVFRSVQPREFVIPTAAIYSASARIPAHLLAETSYTLRANVIITKDGEPYRLIGDNAVTFRVYDTNESFSPRGAYKGQPPGAVMPRLEWKVVKERDVIRA